MSNFFCMVDSWSGRKRASQTNCWGRSGALFRQESEAGEACAQVSSFNKHKLSQWFRLWFLSHRLWKLWLDHDDSPHSKSLRPCSIYKWSIKIWFITIRLYGEYTLKRVPADFQTRLCWSREIENHQQKWMETKRSSHYLNKGCLIPNMFHVVLPELLSKNI